MIARLVTLVVLACAAPALAQVPPKRGSAEADKQAKAHYKQGKAFLDQKLYDDAIKEFETAYALDPLPELLFDDAQAYRLEGKDDKALELYKKFLEQQSEGQAADEARTHVARLTAEKEQRDAEAKRRADEEARRRAEEEAARKHQEEEAARLRKEAEEREKRDAEERARRAEEDKRRAEEARIAEEARQREAAIAAQRDAWDREREKRTKRRNSGYRYAGIGLSCLAAAGAFAYFGAHENDNVKAGGYNTAGDISNAITAGKVFNVFGYAFLVPGIVGVAVGVPMVVMSWDRGPYRATVSPVATPGLTGVQISGTLPW